MPRKPRIEIAKYYHVINRGVEQNPLKANIVKELESYTYSSYHYFLSYKEIPKCLLLTLFY